MNRTATSENSSPLTTNIENPHVREGSVMRAIAILRPDLLSGKDLDSIRALARRMHLQLANSDVHITSDPSSLLAHLSTTKPGVVIIPAEPHLRGWMDTVRRIAQVWTIDPLLCWPHTEGRPYRLICTERPPNASGKISHLPQRAPGEIFRKSGHGTLSDGIGNQLAQSFTRDLRTLQRIARHLRAWPAASGG